MKLNKFKKPKYSHLKIKILATLRPISFKKTRSFKREICVLELSYSNHYILICHKVWELLVV